ncbi:MAG: succinylglutamate desuccinylase, partial [Polaromonas sp.]
QHDDPQAVQVARRAIGQTLALLKMVTLPVEAMPAEREILRLVDVTDRGHAGDSFSREWRSFDPVKAGEIIGTRHSGAEVKAPHDGFVVFPNPRAEPGQEWFYMAQRRA